MFGPDFLSDLDNGKKRARGRGIVSQRDTRRRGAFTDARGDLIDALCHADRCTGPRPVPFQGDRDMGRVHHDHIGGRNIGKHPVGGNVHRPLPPRGLEVRVALGTAHLVKHLLAGHAVFPQMLGPLPEEIDHPDAALNDKGQREEPDQQRREPRDRRARIKRGRADHVVEPCRNEKPEHGRDRDQLHKAFGELEKSRTPELVLCPGNRGDA